MMLAPRTVLVALVATLAATAIVPAASGDHCETKAAIYGRVALTPLPPPPYTSFNQGICVRGFEAVDQHALPPNTDQVMVRVNGDFGSSIPSLTLELDGLGFVQNIFTLHRTANEFGGHTYQLSDWLLLPDGPADGEITATVDYPGRPVSVTYHTSATVLPPEPPTLPSA